MKTVKRLFNIIVFWFTLASFLTTGILPAFAQQLVTSLSAPINGVSLPVQSKPVLLQGMKVDRDDPFRFDFLFKGSNDASGAKDPAFRVEADRMVKYFLAALTTPEKDMWVNLSPYEKERIIADEFGLTDMGRGLLEEDYILKQLSSSLVYPESDLGARFWKEVYRRAYERYGTTDIPTNTFNKVWIVPEVRVYEDEATNSVIIVESRLKVMLEGDYVAMAGGKTAGQTVSASEKELQELSSNVFREIVVPQIEREVNEGQDFSTLRQIYHALILAAWFKLRFKSGVLSRGYADHNKTGGLENGEKDAKGRIFAQYVEAYRKGVYAYIKEDLDLYSGEVIARKYFSGGCDWAQITLRMQFNGTRDAAQGILSENKTVSVPVKFSPLGNQKGLDSAQGLSLKKFVMSVLLLAVVSGCSGLNSPITPELVLPDVAIKVQSQRIATASKTRPAASMRDVLKPFEIALRLAVEKGKNRLPDTANEKVEHNTAVFQSILDQIQTGAGLGDIYKALLDLELNTGRRNDPRFGEVINKFVSLPGLYSYGSVDPEKDSVVLVHGANAGPVYGGFDTIIKSLKDEGKNVFLFHYVDFLHPDISSAILAQALAQLRKDSQRRMVLVSHSFGYVIAQNARILDTGLVDGFVAIAPVIGGITSAGIPRALGLMIMEKLGLPNAVRTAVLDPWGSFQKGMMDAWEKTLKNENNRLRMAVVIFGGDPLTGKASSGTVEVLPEKNVRFVSKKEQTEKEKEDPHSNGPLQSQNTVKFINDFISGIAVIPGRMYNAEAKKDQAMKNDSVGGIDLEKTTVDVDRRGRGVSTAFEDERLLHELEFSAGLSVEILAINDLPSAEISRYIGQS